jgi:hypothetical protein
MGSTPESTHPKGPVIVWVNYGLEGWAPKEFDNDQAAIDFILQGGHGSPMVITNVLTIAPKDMPANNYFAGYDALAVGSGVSVCYSPDGVDEPAEGRVRLQTNAASIEMYASELRSALAFVEKQSQRYS